VIALPDRYPDATRLYLVRHAATTLEPGRCCGSLDIGLSIRGHEQARLLAKALDGADLAAVYTSTLERARQTAVELARPHALKPLERPELAEIDFGELEGRSFEEVAATYPDVYATWMSRPTKAEFPGGERFPDFARRVRDTTHELRDAHPGEEIAIVSHGGPIRVVVAAALAMPTHTLFRLDQAAAGISVIDWIDRHPLVRLLNLAVPSDPR
jgi:alpha-ribazole phosphatase/probable phosphoglycerate mutase